jgi:uncharacterized protein YbjT (DUF2867 family)
MRLVHAGPRGGTLASMATAWLAGASGLVGGVLLRRLLEDARFERVVSVGRRTVPVEHRRLAPGGVPDLSAPSALDALEPPDAAFSCLGTTIGKAGSREAFRRVDHDAVLAFARAARAKGARAFVHVSALGADAGSRVFYNAVKGEIERDVAALGFPSAYALRPSLLDGDREEFRLGERVALAVTRALGPLLGKYRPTPVEAIARVMIACAVTAEPGAHVVEAESIRAA